MNQQERLNYLVEEFKKDSGEYRNLRTPVDPEGKRQVLRSLMNIRMPRMMAPAVIKEQDAYLQERSREKGIMGVTSIPTVQNLKGMADFADLQDQNMKSISKHADVISIWQGDITRLAVDAIVNAANSQMLGCFVPMHACIDNCIHTYAGIQLRAECSRQMSILRRKYGSDYEQPTAVPMLTDGYNLPAKKVVHIVGPIVQDALTPALEKDLADCYRRTLDLCMENALKTVAFCCISTGVFRFPNKRAAEIAVKTVTDWLDEHPGRMERIIFNVFKDEDKKYYEEELF